VSQRVNTGHLTGVKPPVKVDRGDTMVLVPALDRITELEKKFFIFIFFSHHKPCDLLQEAIINVLMYASVSDI
jgi:hypothetical protein